MIRIRLGGFVHDAAIYACAPEQKLSYWINLNFKDRHDWLTENARGKWEITIIPHTPFGSNGLTVYDVNLVCHDDIDAVYYRMRW